METKTEYIDLKPTPDGYARTLCHIIRNNPDAKSLDWAIGEVCKAFVVAARNNPEAWHQEAHANR